MVDEIRKFLADPRLKGSTLITGAVTWELAIGVTAGDSQQFIAVVDFSVADLRDLAALHIAVSVAAYPTSDEANAGGSVA
jgi:hypothetical protein